MRTAILIYDGFTSLDATGPFEVLVRLPDNDVQFVSVRGGTVAADQAPFALPSVPLDAFEAPDVVVVAGGSTTQRYLHDAAILDWLRHAHQTSLWTTSVCTGSLLLGAAGLLDGVPATCHFWELESVAVFGAIPTSERVVTHGRIITAAGVSSGIDMALQLVDRLEGPTYAQGVQLAVEYDPQPLYRSGSTSSASKEVLELVTGVYRTHYGPTWAERVRDEGA